MALIPYEQWFEDFRTDYDAGDGTVRVSRKGLQDAQASGDSMRTFNRLSRGIGENAGLWDTMMQGEYGRITAPDASGRLRYGTNIAGLSTSPDALAANPANMLVEINGKPYLRVGSGYDEYVQAFRNMGKDPGTIRRDAFTYRDDTGYLLDAYEAKRYGEALRPPDNNSPFQAALQTIAIPAAFTAGMTLLNGGGFGGLFGGGEIAGAGGTEALIGSAAGDTLGGASLSESLASAGLMDFSAPAVGIAETTPGLALSGLSTPSAVSLAPGGALAATAASASTGVGGMDILKTLFTPIGGVTGAPSIGGSLVSSGIQALVSGLSGGDDGSGLAQRASDIAGQQAAIAQDQWNYYKQHYQPLETNLIQQAMAAGSPDEFARARGAANADVTGAFDKARKQTASRMQSFGLNPASPAYQSGAASVDLAEGAARAGALTTADNLTRDKAYSKALDVVGIGRGIPAQSAASAGYAANAAMNASRLNYLQNQSNMQNAGYAVAPVARALGGAAQHWFNDSTNFAPSFSMPDGLGYGTIDSGSSFISDGFGGFVPALKDGGPVSRYAKGGLVITPHMKMKPMKYAAGGEVGMEPATIDNATGEVVGPEDGLNDSVPATIDGQQPARISEGEFVINEDAVNMTGQEMLAAINRAGLEKREQSPGAPQEQAYRDGGKVRERDMPRRRMQEIRRNPGEMMTDDGRSVGSAGDLMMLMPNAYRGRLDEHEPRMQRRRMHIRAGLDEMTGA